MRRDHCCFALFLVLLFIAPEFPIGAMLKGAPDLSSLSLGFVGLLFWLMASPKLLLNFRRGARSVWGILIILFAVYAWLVSAFSGSIVSILYATQYLFYSLFGFLILGAYLRKASICNELDKVFSIFIAIGTIYSLGVIVSVFTGPIYPHQTLWTARLWGDFHIQQGVGFGVNQNAVGGVLFFFLAASIFLYPRHKRWQLLIVGIMGLALLATLSRSAIFSFALGCIALLSVWTLRILFTGRINQQSVRCVVSTAFIAAGIFVAVILGGFLFLTPLRQETALAILSGFGIGDVSYLAQDMAFRIELWISGLRNWWAQGELGALFGVGFFNSAVIGGKVAWVTAHNFYIAALGDFGLIGLLVFISALFGSIGNAALWTLTSRGKWGVSSFAFLAILALAIHNLTEAFLYSPIFIILLLFSMQLLSTHTRRGTLPENRTI